MNDLNKKENPNRKEVIKYVKKANDFLHSHGIGIELKPVFEANGSYWFKAEFITSEGGDSCD